MGIESSEEMLLIYAKRLRERRKQKKYTLQNLASACKVTKQTLSYIENYPKNSKIKSINAKLLGLLAKNLECTEDFLIGKSDNPYKSAYVSLINGEGTIIPAEFTYPGGKLKNRLFELYGNDLDLLTKIVDFLEEASPDERKLFDHFLNGFLTLLKKK